MRYANDGLLEFVKPSKEGKYLFISAAIQMAGKVDLYINKQCNVAALVESLDGELEIVADSRPSGKGKIIISRPLVDCLNMMFPARTRIPVWFDKLGEALLLGNLDNDEIEFDPKTFQKLELGEISRFNYQLDDCLQVSGTFCFRSEAYSKGDSLAFVKHGKGSVVLESAGKDHLIRKPEVLAFARHHWQKKRLFKRTIGSALVISPSIPELSRLRDIKDYSPLVMDKELYVEMGRDFSIKMSPGVLASMGRQLAVFACGPNLALATDLISGDIHVASDGRIHSIPLSQQIAMDFPGALRLYLFSHGNLLVFSDVPEFNADRFPPPSLFCRLLMTQEHSFPLRRYGNLRPASRSAASILSTKP